MAKKIKDKFGRDTGQWAPGIIYELGYYRDDNWVPFYVGESYKKQQRLNQHKSLVKSNDNSLHVYDYIRNDIESNNIEWTMEVVAEYGNEGPTDLEDEQIMKRLVEGHELRNKKKGNANWKEKFEEEWNEKLRVAEDMRKRGFTSYKKYREQLDYEQRERQIAEANELRRQREEFNQVYLAAMSELEREQIRIKEQREQQRQSIIEQTQVQAEQRRLEREKQDRISRIKQQQQAARSQADAEARAERIRIETERLQMEEQQRKQDRQNLQRLKDPNNLKRNHELAEIQANASLLALYIQTIEETIPNSPVLPEAYKRLEQWRKMKEDLQ